MVVRSSSGSLDGLTVRYGDTQRYDDPMVAATCMMNPPSPAPPSIEQRDLLVSYRVPGSYLVDVAAYTGGMCSPAPREHLAARLRVVVTPGAARANGPQLPGPPEAIVTMDRDLLAAFATPDPDGFVARYVWDFGDGSPRVTTRTDRRTCHDPRTTWPRTTGDPGGTRVRHHYAHAGRHRVTLTVVSTGRDGQDPQRVTARTVVTA